MKKALWVAVVVLMMSIAFVGWLYVRSTSQSRGTLVPPQNSQSSTATTSDTPSIPGTSVISATKTTTNTAVTSVPSLSAVSVSGSVITARYQNMPFAGVNVVDETGTVVWTQELGQGSGVIHISIPSGTASGTYTLQAFSSTKTIYARSAPFTFTAEDFTKPPVIVSFTATSMGTPGAGKYQLAWVVRNANNCQVRDAIHDLQLLADNVGNKGVFNVTTDVSTEYELYCTMSDNGKMPIYSDQKTVTIGT